MDHLQTFALGTFWNLANMVPYAVIAIGAFLLGELILYMREGPVRGGNKSIKDGNLALAFRRFGLFLAIGLGMAGIYTHPQPDLWQGVIENSIYALVLVGMMHVALIVNDAIVLPGVANSAEVRGGNTAVAVAEVGSLLATGVIANAVMSGEDGDIVTALVFFGLGQVVLALAVRVYQLIRSKSAIVAEVERDNLAAGILLGAKLWAYGLIIATAVGGDFLGWQQGLIAFALTAVLGFIFLLIVDWVVDLVIVRWDNFGGMIRSNAVASALVMAGSKVGLAYIASMLLL